MLRFITWSFASCLVLSSVSYGQKAEEPKTAEREIGKPAPKLSPQAQKRLTFPSPYIRLLGLETALKKKGVTIEWAPVYQGTAYKGIETAKFTEKSAACFALGVRFADGVIALMAKDVSKLKSCADDIRALAGKAGVNSKDLPSYSNLISEMEQENWAQVQFEIGMIQQEIVEKLDTETDRSIGTIVASGAWLQGIRYATALIIKYRETEDLSNMLRAAPIAEMITEEINKTSTDILKKPPVQSALKALASIQPLIDISRDAVIPQEKLESILKAATEAVDQNLKN